MTTTQQTITRSNNIEELELELAKLESEERQYYNLEQGFKVVLNSIYGAFGNGYFEFFNIDVAETITLQGQDAILYSEKQLNRYFTDYWHKDFETHKEMGIKVHGQVRKPVVIYIDTDSSFVTLEEIMATTDWTGSIKDFGINLYNIRLKSFIETILSKYATDWNTENYLDFEIESIAKKAIWLTKKKYMQDIVWKAPNVDYESLSKL